MTAEIKDLDSYLDDVLDEFKEESPLSPPMKSEIMDQSSQEEFMKLLQENMSKLMEDAALENMSKLMEDAALEESLPTVPTRQTTGEFQDTISQTLKKLKASSSEAEAQVASNPVDGLMENMDGDAMEQMMKELEGLMETGEFDEMFGGFMNQLASKDLLYEPMKDLSTKYSPWLKENEATLSKDDLERYQKQHAIVLEIVAVFDACQEKEPNEQESQKIIDLMQEMQSFGNPPESLMGDLIPGGGAADPLAGADMPNECKQM